MKYCLFVATLSIVGCRTVFSVSSFKGSGEAGSLAKNYISNFS